MAPSIEIESEIFEFLKSNAEPLVDTPNTVLRRLLGLEVTPNEQPSDAKEKPSNSGSTRTPNSDLNAKVGGRRKKRRGARAPSGSLMPESEYELPILRVLDRHSGRAASREVVTEVGRIVKDKLKPNDFETVSSGGVRWENRVHFCRLRLIERGLLKRGSPRGVWEISEEGSALIREI